MILKALVLFLTLFLYFHNLGLNQVWQPNEAFYADGARNMLRTGDILTPVYNGEVRLNKPPMTYWITALGFLLFGVNEFALRFFHALLGLGTGLLTYLMARRLSPEGAFLSGVILLLSFQFVANSRYASPEVPLTFFVTLTLYLWLESYVRKSNLLLFLAFTASGMAVLTKGPVGFVMPALIVFVYLLLADRREVLRPAYYLGTLYLLVISGWWYLYQAVNNGEILAEVFLKENVKRIYAMESDPVYYYLLDIPVSFLPYSFLVYPATLWALRRRNLLLPLVWFLSFLVIFSLVKMKLPLYVMPAFPAMAILTASFLTEVKSRLVSLSLGLLWVLCLFGVWAGVHLLGLGIGTAVLVTAVGLVPLLLGEVRILPAFGGLGILLFISSSLLPEVERYRPYREIGEEIKRLDPEGRLRTYQVGVFHESLPFYAERVILKGLPDKGPALVLTPARVENCKTLKNWKVYRGSESRFVKFLRDIKVGRNFGDLHLCIFESEG